MNYKWPEIQEVGLLLSSSEKNVDMLYYHIPFRVLCTFRVSGNGQVLYMSSASEIQRLSIVKDDR